MCREQVAKFKHMNSNNNNNIPLICFAYCLSNLSIVFRFFRCDHDVDIKRGLEVCEMEWRKKSGNFYNLVFSFLSLNSNI